MGIGLLHLRQAAPFGMGCNLVPFAYWSLYRVIVRYDIAPRALAYHMHLVGCFLRTLRSWATLLRNSRIVNRRTCHTLPRTNSLDNPRVPRLQESSHFANSSLDLFFAQAYSSVY